MVNFITQEDQYKMIWNRTEDSVGAFKTKLAKNDFYLFPLNCWDQDFCKNVNLKSGEKIFRYETETTKIGGMRPLIKINMLNGLAYYLINSDTSIIFESRGVKPVWISMNISEK